MGSEAKNRMPPAVVPAAGVLFAALAIAVALGIANGGSLITVLKEMAANPWGRATLIDLYVGFFLFALWIFHRERSKARAAGWLVATCLLGNLVPCVYVIAAARSARGNGARFWHGS